MLAACSSDTRPADSELRADASTAPGRAATPLPAPAESGVPLTGAGQRYKVAVGTAYFFDKPKQSMPNGRYLRRGDTFFGEGESNGFVKTSFVQPNGAAGTAWLKRQELMRLPGKPVAAALPSREPHSPTGPLPVQPKAEREKAIASAGGTAVVKTARAYFYNSPDLATPRKAYCERGDKVHLGQREGEAVYVTFTNWEKVTTTGWMRQGDLGL